MTQEIEVQDPHANRDWSHSGGIPAQGEDWGTTGLSDTPMTSDKVKEVIDAKSFSYLSLEVGELQAEFIETQSNTGDRKFVIEALDIAGDQYKVTERFMTSFYAKFGFGKSVLTYWSPPEIFERLAERAPRTEIQLTMYRGSVLAVSDPSKSIMDAVGLGEVLGSEGGAPLSLHWDGKQFVSIHSVPEHPFDVLGETFEPRFVMMAPVDGYGKPAIYLTVMRHACLNALMAYAKDFRSEVQLGKGDPTEPLMRTLASFNNEEGFATLRKRIEVAGETAASVWDVGQLRKHMVQALRPAGESQLLSTAQPKLFGALTAVTGDVSEMFQVGGDGWIPPIRQQKLHVPATMMDLVNMATEVTTHHGKLLDRPDQLLGWVGKTMASVPFHLEGISLSELGENAPSGDPKDFYLPMDLSRDPN